MKKLLATGILFLMLGGNAHADAPQPKQWQVDAAHSTLTFQGNQNGQAFAGGFKRFAAQIALDPDHPETGKVNVTVDIASAYAGSSDRDAMLPQKDWFDTSKFPQAQLTSTAIRKTGPWKYEMDATLTLKGVSRSLTIPFTLAPSKDMGDGYWRAQGQATLLRNDFGVGQGSFASEDYVKHAVTVAFDLEAK